MEGGEQAPTTYVKSPIDGATSYKASVRLVRRSRTSLAGNSALMIETRQAPNMQRRREQYNETTASATVPHASKDMDKEQLQSGYSHPKRDSRELQRGSPIGSLTCIHDER